MNVECFQVKQINIILVNYDIMRFKEKKKEERTNMSNTISKLDT